MKKRPELSKRQILLLHGTWMAHILSYYGGRAVAVPQIPRNLAVALDHQIPVIPWTVLIYWGGVLFWIVSYIAGVRYDKGNGYRLLVAHFTGTAICSFFFVFFPVEIARTEITGNSFCEWILKLTYQVDAGNNCFPSTHCLYSWFCWIGVRKNRNIPGRYQVLAFVIAVSICISTLTVKQHFLADVPAGILLAEISYWIAAKLERAFEKRTPQACMDPRKDRKEKEDRYDH